MFLSWAMLQATCERIKNGVAGIIGLLMFPTVPAGGTLAPKPVLRRVFPALMSVLALLVLCGASVTLLLYRRQNLKSDPVEVAAIARDLQLAVEQQSFQLLAAMQPVLDDPRLVSALRSADAEQLLADWHPLYETLHREKHLTHFAFFATNHVCLLRVHQPDQRGGVINSFVLQEAQRTGTAAFGLELWPLGTLSLRVVQPVIRNGELVGYVEMGKEIEEILRPVSAAWPDNRLAVVVHKSLLNRPAWEASMRALGHPTEWNRLARNVIVCSVPGRLPDGFNAMADRDPQGGPMSSEVTREIKTEGSLWHVTTTPLLDASGKEIGDLVAMHDAVLEAAGFRQIMTLALAGSMVLLACILGFVYVLLHRTDLGIAVQQASLQSEKQKLAAIFKSAPIGMLLLDKTAAVVDANAAAQKIFTLCSEDVAAHQPGNALNCIHSHEHEKGCGHAAACAKCLLRDSITRALTTGTSVHDVELYFKCGDKQDARVYWLLVSAEPVVVNDQPHVVVSFADITERKQMEDALHETQLRYKNLFDSAADAIMTLEPPDWRFTSGNPATLRLFGVKTVEAFTATGPWAVSPERQPDGRLSSEKAREMIEIAARDGSNFFAWTHQRINGEEFPATVLLSRMEHYGKTFLQATVRDISAQKHAEELLQQTTDRLTLATRAGGVGIWDYDVVNNVLIWDEQMYRLYGITADKFGGAYEAWQAGLHPDDKQRGDQEVQQALAGEKDFNTEFRVIWPDGSIHDIRAMALVHRDKTGKPLHLIGTNWDITARKKEEQALVESETRFRTLFDGAADGMIVLDLDTQKFVMTNAACLKMLGYTKEEFLRLGVADLHSPEDLPFLVEQMKNFLQGLPNKSDDVRFKRKDGSLFAAAMNPTLLSLDGRQHSLISFRDITDRKKAEQEIVETTRHLEEATARANAMAAQAEMASTAKSNFLASMSHEIRTPLNGVLGMTRLLLGTPLSDEQRRYADIVKTSADSLLTLLNDILDYSKMEAGKIRFEQLDFNLEALLDESTTALALRAHEKGLELLCCMAPRVPVRLQGDPARLRQILLNLVGNAIKFTHQGEVVIRVTCEAETAADATLRFSVRDTGIGIPAKKQNLLFQQFSQVDASTTRKYGGTGLGLAISRQLVEMMGGTIHVSSAEGQGSEFWFVIRLPKQSASPASSDQGPSRLTGVRLLVVDDQATSRSIFTSWAAAWEMRTAEAADGPAALALLQRALEEGDPFQCVLIDRQMPGMDGAALGRAIQAEPRYANTRRIIYTALGRADDANEFEAVGVDAWLMKPLRRLETRAVLEKVLAAPTGSRADVPSAVLSGPVMSNARKSDFVLHDAGKPKRLANRKGRILLAEDDPTNQMVALGMLNMLGLTADTAVNGREALRALEKQDYDLVLMDCQMPELDGFAATRRIRNLNSAVRNHQIPIVAMTANAMSGDQQKCLDAGMNGYVAKPVDPDLLAAELKKWLPAVHHEDTETQSNSTSVSSCLRGENSAGGNRPVWDRAGMLSRLMNNQELAQVVLQGFVEDLPRQIRELRATLESGRTEDALRHAHSIKGATAAVGGEVVRATAAEIEAAGRQGDLPAMRNRLADLEAGAADLVRVIEQGLKGA